MQTRYTSRLCLRTFDDDDAAAFSAYRSDAEIARYQSWTPPYSLEQARQFIAGMKTAEAGAPGTWYQIAIERRDEPGLIGDCVFHVFDDGQAHHPGFAQAEIGFTLAREHQSKGYAKEALQSLLGYLFDEQCLHRVTATCDADNLRSSLLLQRLGFRQEAHYISNIYFKGAWGSEFAYALLRSEWMTRSPTGNPAHSQHKA